jgi:4-amino-4-deoxy-L-arabinose transferase-like glycosyltransferase
MSLKLSRKHSSDTDAAPPTRGTRLRLWFLRLLAFVANTWEIFFILLVAGYLRFYQINTTELDEDQARLYRMAYDAVHHGLLPTTSNAASIGIANPPGVIYLFMPLAALSANPLWGAALVGIFTTAAALLTYFFTRRYYGRLVGIVAALLYATAAKPLNYARFIWQPNLMPPFVVLFMFALFWGVVERRKGWLFPALVLFGILYQMHPTTLLLVVPLIAAIILAPGTFRWRDIALALIVLLVIFSPYLIWETYIRFADIRTLFHLAKQPAHIDTQAIHFYRVFLSPYDTLPADAHSLVRMLAPMLSWLLVVVPLLTLGGFVTAGILLLRSGDKQHAALDQGWMWRVRNWWMDLLATRYRCGLLVLLTWQIIPLLLLSRHAIDLHAQYFFMFMPGPFILIGLFLTKAVEYFQTRERQWHIWRYAVYAITCLVIGAQLVGSTAAIIDTSNGNFDDRAFQPYPYHNDLRSLQHALSEADRLAQQRHLNRVYITTDFATQTALRYLAEQTQTPTTLFDATRCLVLPNPADGPAVLLTGPYDELTNALLSRFASATLVDSPPRLGGPPFRLYIVTPGLAQTSFQSAFAGNLQLLQTQTLSFNDTSWLVSRWSLLHPEQPGFRTTYNYTLTASLNGSSQQSKCTFTAIRSGDQLLAAFSLSNGNSTLTSAAVKAQFFTTVPNNPYYGPSHLETEDDQNTPAITLHTVDGSDSIRLSG